MWLVRPSTLNSVKPMNTNGKFEKNRVDVLWYVYRYIME
jgi:hypothetical protein